MRNEVKKPLYREHMIKGAVGLVSRLDFSLH